MPASTRRLDLHLEAPRLIYHQTLRKVCPHVIIDFRADWGEKNPKAWDIPRGLPVLTPLQLLCICGTQRHLQTC
jgi:hypothetical protein